MPNIQTEINNIYIACTVRSSEDGKQYYVPMIILSQSLKTYYLLASSDLVSLQMKNESYINEIAALGVKVIYIAVDVGFFKEVTNAITENLNVTVNTYLSALKEYNRVVGVLGKTANKKDLSYYLYSALIGQNPCCLITPDLKLAPVEELDIVKGLIAAAHMSDIEADDVVVDIAEQYPFNLDILEDIDDDEEDEEGF
jgi:hypothetical protein